MTNTSKLIHDLTWLSEMGAASPEDIARVAGQARTALTKSEALSRLVDQQEAGVPLRAGAIPEALAAFRAALEGRAA